MLRSPLEAEALALCDGLEMGKYIRLWEELTDERDVSIKGYIDRKSLENAVKSNTNVQSRRLRMDMAVLKEMINEGVVKEIKWINGNNQIADELTKEKNNKNGINDYLNNIE